MAVPLWWCARPQRLSAPPGTCSAAVLSTQPTVVMAARQARAKFAFDGQFQPGCITLVEGELLSVLSGGAGAL